MKVVYDWLKDYVGDAMPPIEKLDALFTFHAFEIDGVEQVGAHDVIDVKVLPDRSSDALSHRGVAHELAALMGVKLANDPLRASVALEPKTETLSVTIENAAHCRRFSGARISQVKIGPSPAWLRERLEALGQRSINNVVDATNYVMLALGQPLHAYDATKFSAKDGVWHFGVRMAKNGESITTLTKDTYVLTDAVQLIVDESAGVCAGIAGIKGGSYAEVDAATTDIILEAANFDPALTRRAAQSLTLQTDASKRFENNLPPALTAYGLTACVRLIGEIAGGTCEGYLDVYPTPTSNVAVEVSYGQLTSLLGLVIPKDDVESILTRLGFAYTPTEHGWRVTAPFERTDVTIAEDVIAEVGRVYGYAHVQSVVPPTVPLAELNARHYYSDRIRSLLSDAGFSEVITSSFRATDAIVLANALASDKGCLRSTLRKNIEEALDRNMPFVDLVGVSHVTIFEIGTIFTPLTGTVKGIDEQVSLAIGVRMKQQGYTPKDDARLTEIAALLETALGAPLHAHIERGVLECNLSSLIARLPMPRAYEPYVPGAQTLYTPFSLYPHMSRDIALWVPAAVAASTIEDTIRAHAGDLLVRSTCFDTFTKEGRTSYAFRLVFQAYDRTLTDDEASTIMARISEALRIEGYEVR